MVHTSQLYRLVLLGRRYARFRECLRGPEIAQFLDCPLAMWVSSDDRGLPRGLLGHPLRVFLDVDFETIAGFPGVGIVKLRSLLDLFERIVAPGVRLQDALMHEVNESAAGREPLNVVQQRSRFTPPLSPAGSWDHNCEVITACRLTALPVGQVISCLSDIPRRLWCEPIGAFTRYSYNELHEIPAFGKLRVASMMQLVADVAHYAGRMSEVSVNDPTWLAGEVREAADWIDRYQHEVETPSIEAILNQFVAPLLRRIQIDCSPREVAVARQILSAALPGRLSIVNPDYSVEGLARSRVWQIRVLISDALAVRFPRGGELLQALISRHTHSSSSGVDAARLLRAAYQLFFAGPTSRAESSSTVEVREAQLSS